MPLVTFPEDKPATASDPVIRCNCGETRGLSGAVKDGWLKAAKGWLCGYCNSLKQSPTNV